MKKERGITLVSLVVTIIILIILAVVGINLILGENGIIIRSKSGSEEYIKAQLKEELEFKITDIQVQKIEKGENIRREDLNKLTEIGATIISTEIPTLGEYKDYEFMIDENYIVTIMGKAIGVKPEIKFTKDTEEIVDKVTITVNVTTTDGTIEFITKPDGTNTQETSFQYEATENKKYTFVAKGSNGRMTIASIDITNVKETAQTPIIESKYGYPILKETGIELDGTTTITYDTKEGFENYYSLDNGTTWNKYQGPFSIASAGTIQAKTIKNNVILAQASQTITTPTDALTYEAYDRDSSTYCNIASHLTKKILVDPSMRSKNIRLVIQHSYASSESRGGSVIERLEDGTTNTLASANRNLKDDIFQLSSNVKELYFTEKGAYNFRVYEVQPSNE